MACCFCAPVRVDKGEQVQIHVPVSLNRGTQYRPPCFAMLQLWRQWCSDVMAVKHGLALHDSCSPFTGKCSVGFRLQSMIHSFLGFRDQVYVSDATATQCSCTDSWWPAPSSYPASIMFWDSVRLLRSEWADAEKARVARRLACGAVWSKGFLHMRMHTSWKHRNGTCQHTHNMARRSPCFTVAILASLCLSPSGEAPSWRCIETLLPWVIAPHIHSWLALRWLARLHVGWLQGLGSCCRQLSNNTPVWFGECSAGPCESKA